MKYIRASYVGDVINITNLIQTNAQIFSAVAVMDKVSGWNEEGSAMNDGKADKQREWWEVGGVHVDLFICNGQSNGRVQGKRAEANNWSCNRGTANHDWFSALSMFEHDILPRLNWALSFRVLCHGVFLGFPSLKSGLGFCD